MNNEELNKNTGVIFDPPTETDFLAGTIPYQEILPDGNWEKYLPADEYQNKGVESMACVSFSANNDIETQLNRYLLEDLLPETVLNDFRNLGYIKDGLFNFSDRFLAKMSGTTTQGNSMQNVLNAVRHYGLVAEDDWPSDWTSWATYYRGIPVELKTKALNFLQYFDTAYEWLVNGGHLDLGAASYHLKQAPLQIATATCSGWNSGDIVQYCNWAISHATMIYGTNGTFNDFDSYEPFEKKLASNYNIPLAMKVVVTPKFTLKKKGETMAKLERKKNTEQVFLNLNGVRYWIKDAIDFENIQKSQPITISWSEVTVVDEFSGTYGGEIIGKTNLADALKVLFGKVS